MSTIAAISTAPGLGALSIIRISGDAAHSVVLTAIGRKKPLAARMVTLVHVRDKSGRTLDECIAVLFAAPASFTGEDVVELTCHGGMLVTQRVLERLFECGAQPAEPGEFSRRAFENGKLDLTEAEAIMDIIRAGSDLALRAAQSQLAGSVSRPVQNCIDHLLSLLAHLEAYIDFPEEDISPQSQEEISVGLREIREQLSALAGTADAGRLLREGIRTAIIGPPNAGKSSLLNRLLGYERAIVSPTPGTTRDTIEESLSVRGLLLHLIDTAGLRHTEDPLELQGVERSQRARQAADLVLDVQDATSPFTPWNTPPPGVPYLRVLNKCDLPMHASRCHRDALRVSALTGEGIPLLLSAITDVFAAQCGEFDSSVAINTRHLHALRFAISALDAAISELENNTLPELIAVDLHTALDSLSSITGRIDSEDLLTRIFSSFCLGK